MVSRWRWKLGARAIVVTLSAALPLAACNAILGIPEATVDPLLEGSGGASSSVTSSSSGSGEADADADVNVGSPCASYCQTIASNCTGINAEYISLGVCMAMCSSFDPGKEGDRANDSLACRKYHAEQAATDPIVHCQQAGPLAAGPCATPCSAFCLLDYTLCSPHGLFDFDGGTKGCREACEGIPYILSADQADAGAAGDILFLSGDTLNCRIYHLESAYNPGDPNAVTTHCPHTAVDSAACN